MVSAGTPVIFSAHSGVLGTPSNDEIVLHAVALFAARRHVRPVEAEAAAVQKLPVLKSLRQDHPGHRVQQRAVGGGPQRDPFRIQRLNGIALPGIHHDDGNAFFPGFFQPVHRGTVKMRLRRVVSPQEDQLAVEPGLGAASGGVRAVHQARRAADACAGVGIIVVEISAVQCQQPLRQRRGPKHRADAGGIVDVARTGAIAVPDALPLFGDALHGLIPADAGKLSLSPRAHAEHRVAEPVFPQKGPVIVQAPHTGGQGNAAGAVRLRLRRHAQDLPVPDMGVQEAAPAAIVSAGGGDDAYFSVRHAAPQRI